ncbi:MAG TPA: ATP synthase F1 subunit epsilon [Bryobacteraceae bacterium]|nr:ATP synthase F1 subunit epsilon [Bryobacteraceae bacterium]
MPELIELEVVTPERLLVREQVADVQLPAKDGYLGILPGHAPLLGLLGTGFLSYAAGAGRRYLSVNGGFLEVLPGHVRVLADTAERAEEIDVQRAKAAFQRAQDLIMNPSIGIDPAAALDAMMRAQARIEAAEKK